MEEVLRELESQDKPRIYVMNKVDLLSEKKRESLRDSDNVVHVSAAKGTRAWTSCWQLIDAKIDEDPVQTRAPARAAVRRQSLGDARC